MSNRLEDNLILHQWMLRNFEADSFEALAQGMDDVRLEDLTDDRTHKFLEHLITSKILERTYLSEHELRQYDENIVRHTDTINKRRAETVVWKYFQYLSLLFTEMYLDLYFKDKYELLKVLNTYVAERRAANGEIIVSDFDLSDIKKLAFHMATGSGKTLLMHVNMLQVQYYIQKYGHQAEFNRVVLITPNESLSQQHIDEMLASSIDASLFNQSQRRLFGSSLSLKVDVIDINKLKESAGEKTVAVESFEANNLVFIDEGHRGVRGGEEWKKNRDALSERGFAFEYSATFGQAVDSAATARKKELINEYGKAILFNYPYRYFYNDGFGKDYRIVNLQQTGPEDSMWYRYQIGGLLTFLEQLLIYEREQNQIRPFLIDRPLYLFAGGSVTKSSTAGDVPDVLLICQFLDYFLKERAVCVTHIQKLLSGDSSLRVDGIDIFESNFKYLKALQLDPADVYTKVLDLVFNSPSGSGVLSVENLKGIDGEIGLRVGQDYFGVINVGDDKKLVEKCSDLGIQTSEVEFTASLFRSINTVNSRITMLIGARKFNEGWSSWRVSTMGLMKIGRSEGSQIIQMFGRGVRLRGYGHALKRSGFLKRTHIDADIPDFLAPLETLAVFGVRSDYMQDFKTYLQNAGLKIVIRRKVVEVLTEVNYVANPPLKTIRINPGYAPHWKRERIFLRLPEDDVMKSHMMGRVKLNWYPKLQALAPSEEAVAGNQDVNTVVLSSQQLAVIDYQQLYFELEDHKKTKGLHGLIIEPDMLPVILGDSSWYRLEAPSELFEARTMKQIAVWQEIVASLLKSYVVAYYHSRQQQWSSDHIEYIDMQTDDANIIRTYEVAVDEVEDDVLKKVRHLSEVISRALEQGNSITEQDVERVQMHELQSILSPEHLYNPLFYIPEHVSKIQVERGALNDGEKKFVTLLRAYVRQEASRNLHGKQIYLIRNQSRAGVSFFEADNFYPDFIIWIVEGDVQHIVFVDPKGLIRASMQGSAKLEFGKNIKTLEQKLGNPDIHLHSFILSVTPKSSVQQISQMTDGELRDLNVLFLEDQNCLHDVFDIIFKSLTVENA